MKMIWNIENFSKEENKKFKKMDILYCSELEMILTLWLENRF